MYAKYEPCISSFSIVRDLRQLKGHHGHIVITQGHDDSHGDMCDSWVAMPRASIG